MDVYSTTYKDQKAIALESSRMRIKFLPETGAGLASVYDKKTNREFLVQRPEPQYRRVPFDGSYVDGECCGLDDMFPTIDECFYAGEPWKGVRLADHGEVWNLPCETELSKDKVKFQIQGIRLPYRFEKTATLSSENVLTLSYRVTNSTPFDMDFLWAAHTMLIAEPGLRLFVPEDCRIGEAVFSSTGRIGKYGDTFTFPEFTDPSGVVRRVDCMDRWEANSEKYYFKNRLAEGWCAVRYPDGNIFGLSFPAEKVPYLGILHNPGGWRDMFNIFLEPCTAPFDRPDIAALRGQGSSIKANSTLEWQLNLVLDEAPSVRHIDLNGKLTP